MTTAEARAKLKNHGLTDDQAVGVVDVLELWEKDRGLSRDYLDAKLGEITARAFPRLIVRANSAIVTDHAKQAGRRSRPLVRR